MKKVVGLPHHGKSESKTVAWPHETEKGGATTSCKRGPKLVARPHETEGGRTSHPIELNTVARPHAENRNNGATI